MERHLITSTETSIDGVAGADGVVEAAAATDRVAGPVAGSNRQPRFLSDVIVALGFADAGAVEQAEQEARERGRSLTDVLLDKGELTEEQLAQSIGVRSGLDYVDLDEFDIDLGAAELIDPSAARRYCAVPIAFNGAGELVVAIADPVDALAVSDIAVITKSKVRTVVAGRSAIGAVIECLPKAAPHPPAIDEALPQTDRREQDATPVAPPDEAEGTGQDVAGPMEAAQPNADVIGDALERARSGAADTIASPRLQERIIQLVESALDGAAQSEVGVLEAELTRQQEARGILEAELATERQDRGALEAELTREQEARGILEAELERERESRSSEREASMVEREEWTRKLEELERERTESVELERGMRERIAAASQKSAELDRLLAELTATTTRADHHS
jgi:MshEN domain